MIKVAIDAMGGDFGPAPIVEGVVQALKKVKFTPVLVGDKAEILKFLPKKYHGKIEILHTTDYIKMEEGATDALKRKESSIFMAVDLVKNKQADAIVSAGHSGATMSLSTLRIGRLEGILRPAIATLMPNINRGKTLVLDVGANVDCTSENLVQFAIMGEAYARCLLHKEQPRVGLIANGEENTKGNKVVKETHLKLKERKDIKFIGNVEGGDIFKGTADVVVCDGFVGNSILKASEGVAYSVYKMLKKSVMRSPLAIFGAILMLGAFKTLKKELDYAEYGGAPLIGINGCSIVSHGKSNAKAIKNAILQAIKFVETKVNDDIIEHISNPKGSL
ncbi:MAG: phosphate acyltransferase PlsX [Helicobacteraceae bacterium]